MSNKINKEMEKIIRDWGLPETEYIMQNREYIDYIFDEDGPEKTKKQDSTYKCEANDVQFYLYDKLNEKTLFSMGFFHPNSKLASLRGNEKVVNLDLIYVHEDSLRKTGISTYYIKKLQRYAFDRGVDYIRVIPNVNLKRFKKGKNALSQPELEGFYNRLSETGETPIRF
ncbi:hypothetical protein RGU74_07590 [Bacillus cereus]|uniref:hypothetical protein n=1 Tax=Bacillus cereus TaxID=1396 RepID=UPI0028534A8C|nr:hypothetical protein [Bacillus cereus]MDR4983566.1 hypothetical protein [Bacillus cereus]